MNLETFLSWRLVQSEYSQHHLISSLSHPSHHYRPLTLILVCAKSSLSNSLFRLCQKDWTLTYWLFVMIFMNTRCMDFSRYKDFCSSNLSCSNRLINFFVISIEVKNYSSSQLSQNCMLMTGFGWYLLCSFSSRSLYPNHPSTLASFSMLFLLPHIYYSLSKLLKKTMTCTTFFKVCLFRKVCLFISFLTILT